MWVLGGLAVLVVVVLTVAATLFVTGRQSEEAGPDPANPSPTTAVDTSEITSADDDGPVAIITEDPTCAAWTPIRNRLVNQDSRAWDGTEPSVPASKWSTEQREQHKSMADEMRAAAAQTVALARQTPHRVMRELYTQSIAYWRAYADKLETYVPSDDHLARVATTTANSVTWICAAIDGGSATARAPLVAPSPAPKRVQPPHDPDATPRFLEERLSVCSRWVSSVGAFAKAISDRISRGPNAPVEQWTPEQHEEYLDASLHMTAYANKLQALGVQSDNAVFEDFASLAAQYRLAYVESFTTHLLADTYLADASAELSAVNTQACLAVGAG